jgi:hypothetical protein
MLRAILFPGNSEEGTSERSTLDKNVALAPVTGNCHFNPALAFPGLGSAPPRR